MAIEVARNGKHLNNFSRCHRERMATTRARRGCIQRFMRNLCDERAISDGSENARSAFVA
jgi:hypothetical protein